MWSRRRRSILSGGLLILLPLALAGCPSSDTTSSLIDWASTASGGLLQIFVKQFLTNAVQPPFDPNAPISTQQH